jgi:hypothetical protein
VDHGFPLSLSKQGAAFSDVMDDIYFYEILTRAGTYFSKKPLVFRLALI